MDGCEAAEVIERLGLIPHPEGGWYREMFRDLATNGERAHSTAIYFLLGPRDRSHWHRVDAVEVWHHYAGAPLRLDMSEDGRTTTSSLLGKDIFAGQSPQVVVPTGWWQAATPLGGWVLVGCTVAPGFQFSGFELAPPDWAPSQCPPAAAATLNPAG
ncbi:MAG TPA: cupin domain-containing protein [Rhizobiaceae bacterium]|nr:cupin domain-containing protein [Rhizobiaceae bacterium]